MYLHPKISRGIKSEKYLIQYLTQKKKLLSFFLLLSITGEKGYEVKEQLRINSITYTKSLKYIKAGVNREREAMAGDNTEDAGVKTVG